MCLLHILAESQPTGFSAQTIRSKVLQQLRFWQKGVATVHPTMVLTRTMHIWQRQTCQCYLGPCWCFHFRHFLSRYCCLPSTAWKHIRHSHKCNEQEECYWPLLHSEGRRQHKCVNIPQTRWCWTEFYILWSNDNWGSQLKLYRHLPTTTAGMLCKT